MRHQGQELDPTYKTPASSSSYQDALEQLQGRSRSLLPSPSLLSRTLSTAASAGGDTTTPGGGAASGADNGIALAEEEHGDAGAVTEDADADAVSNKMEVMFIRRLRMGGMKASVNTTGFNYVFLNVTDLLAEITPLTVTGEVLGWKELASHLLWHIGYSVAMHGTSNIISSLFNWRDTGTNLRNSMIGAPRSALTQAGGAGNSGTTTRDSGSSRGGGFHFMSRKNRNQQAHTQNSTNSGGSKDSWGNGGASSSSSNQARGDGDGNDENNSEEQHRNQMEKLLGKRAK
jgi:hypothetical protein